MPLRLSDIGNSDLLLCPVCRNIYEDPKLLPCLHTLCKECVVTQLAKTINSKIGDAVEMPKKKHDRSNKDARSYIGSSDDKSGRESSINAKRDKYKSNSVPTWYSFCSERKYLSLEPPKTDHKPRKIKAKQRQKNRSRNKSQESRLDSDSVLTHHSEKKTDSSNDDIIDIEDTVPTSTLSNSSSNSINHKFLTAISEISLDNSQFQSSFPQCRMKNANVNKIKKSVKQLIRTSPERKPMKQREEESKSLKEEIMNISPVNLWKRSESLDVRPRATSCELSIKSFKNYNSGYGRPPLDDSRLKTDYSQISNNSSSHKQSPLYNLFKTYRNNLAKNRQIYRKPKLGPPSSVPFSSRKVQSLSHRYFITSSDDKEKLQDNWDKNRQIFRKAKLGPPSSVPFSSNKIQSSSHRYFIKSSDAKDNTLAEKLKVDWDSYFRIKSEEKNQSSNHTPSNTWIRTEKVKQYSKNDLENMRKGIIRISCPICTYDIFLDTPWFLCEERVDLRPRVRNAKKSPLFKENKGRNNNGPMVKPKEAQVVQKLQLRGGATMSGTSQESEFVEDSTTMPSEGTLSNEGNIESLKTQRNVNKPRAQQANDTKVNITWKSLAQFIDETFASNTFYAALANLQKMKNERGHLCSYCSGEGNYENALAFCLDCQEDLCSSCMYAHTRTKLTRDHNILPHEEIRNGYYDEELRSIWVAPCPCSARKSCQLEERKSRILQFCSECKMPTCKECVEELHKGHDLMSLSQATTCVFAQMEKVNESFGRRGVALADYEKILDVMSSKLQNSKDKAVSSIVRQSYQLENRIRDMRDLAIHKVREACYEEGCRIEKKKREVKLASTVMKDNHLFLNALVHCGLSEEFAGLYRPIFERYEQIVTEKPCALHSLLNMKFKPGTMSNENMEVVMGALCLNQIPVEQHCLPESQIPIMSIVPEVKRQPELLLSFNTNTPSDVEPVYPSGIAVNKTFIAVADRANAKIKMFDHNGELWLEFNGKTHNNIPFVKPYDIVFLPNDKLVVSDCGNASVKIYDWEGNFEKLLKGDYKLPRGMCLTDNGNLFVLDATLRKLMMYRSSDGELVREIELRSKDQEQELTENPDPQTLSVKYSKTFHSRDEFLIDPHYIAPACMEQLVISDVGSPNLRFFQSLTGDYLFESSGCGVHNHENIRPAGIIRDRFGYLLVADAHNSRVHLSLTSGRLTGSVLDTSHGLKHPVSLSLDITGNLVVGQTGGKIKVFRYL